MKPAAPEASKRHVCVLCEAGCGLMFTMQQGRPRSVRGNPNDVTSKGFLCPKGAQMLGLERDPDRVREPLRRTPQGDFSPITWDQAFDEVAGRLRETQEQHGKDAVAVYFGTVAVHKYDILLVRTALIQALKTRNFTGASSQDTSSRFAASHMLYGSTLSLAVPDVDRTHFFFCLGANPVVSNGSMMTAPNMRERLRAITRRGGKVVIVDPRFSESAREASEHVSIRPGTDAALVLSMVQYLVATKRVDERRLRRQTQGWLELRARLAPFTPERVQSFTGVPKSTIERLALEFVTAPTSVAYSRMGMANSRHATLGCFAVELLNLVGDRLGRVGGAMFPTPAIDVQQLARLTQSDGFDRYQSRVRGLPETIGELPATTLAEEIETPGPGQVRALLTFAGNPVLAVPQGRRLGRALAGLDFMVSVDCYVNETTLHADIILPPAPLLSDEHVDLWFANLAVHDNFRWSPAVLPLEPNQRTDAQILLELAERLGGGITGKPPVDAVLRWLGIQLTPARLANWALRLGPHGDRFLPWNPGLNAERALGKPDGWDLGPLRPGFRHRIFHPDRRIQLAPGRMFRALDELRDAMQRASSDELLLIGRRQLRTNNSWMHNVAKLVSGRDGCDLLLHPDDAARFEIQDGTRVVLENHVHSALVTARVSDAMRPGVVSLPHGYGHAALAGWQGVASAQEGPSFNDWTDDTEVEAVVGQSILNGIAVRVRAVANSE